MTSERKNSKKFTEMNSNGVNQLILGPLTQTAYEAPISVDISGHPLSNGHINGHHQLHNQRSTIRWNQAGISTSAERRLPFVHRFRGLPPPAGLPAINRNIPVKPAKASNQETNPVGALQERFQSRGVAPVYQVIQAEGASHCPTFTYQVFISDLMASGSGNSKKQAKHAAARAMLDKIDGTRPPSSLPTNPGDPTGSATSHDGMDSVDGTGNPVGHLQEFCVKHGLPIAVYEAGGINGLPHQRLFEMVCKVGVLTITGKGSSKRESKRRAAGQMLDSLKEAGADVHGVAFANQTNDETTKTDEKANVKTSFQLNLDVEGPKLVTLLQTSLVKKTDIYTSQLLEVATEQNFDVDFIEMGEKLDNGSIQCLVQISRDPMIICHGVGSDVCLAKNSAARNALNFIKILAQRKIDKEKPINQNGVKI